MWRWNAAAHDLEKQAEAFHDEAERHERNARAIPREQGALGREQNPGILQCRHCACSSPP